MLIEKWTLEYGLFIDIEYERVLDTFIFIHEHLIGYVKTSSQFHRVIVQKYLLFHFSTWLLFINLCVFRREIRIYRIAAMVWRNPMVLRKW